MSNQLVKNSRTISTRIGNDFQFKFCNWEDEAFVVKKKLSPSQMKRNINRKLECEIKDEEFEEKKVKVKTKDSE